MYYTGQLIVNDLSSVCMFNIGRFIEFEKKKHTARYFFFPIEISNLNGKEERKKSSLKQYQ